MGWCQVQQKLLSVHYAGAHHLAGILFHTPDVNGHRCGKSWTAPAVTAVVVRIEGKITQERRCPGALWEVHKVTERFAPGESFIQTDKGSPSNLLSSPSVNEMTACCGALSRHSLLKRSSGVSKCLMPTSCIQAETNSQGRDLQHTNPQSDRQVEREGGLEGRGRHHTHTWTHLASFLRVL